MSYTSQPYWAPALLIIAVPTLRAQEQKIKQADLPPPVAAAASALGQGATIIGYTREQDAGQTYYEVALRIHGHSQDVLLDATGAVLEIEEEVVLDSLPLPVQTALRTRAGTARLQRVEALTKRQRLVAYEAHFEEAGRQHEIQVGPMGETLAHEE